MLGHLVRIYFSLQAEPRETALVVIIIKAVRDGNRLPSDSHA